MKTLTKTLAILTTAATFAANASISVEDDATTNFEIGGTIPSECKVSSSALSGASSLDLSTTDAQNAATVSVWCNTGQASANTTYSSENDGRLFNSDRNEYISYLLDIGSTSNVNLNSDHVESQTAGSGTSGTSADTTIAIRPQVNGFESEGNYTDTITVTVSYN